MKLENHFAYRSCGDSALADTKQALNNLALIFLLAVAVRFLYRLVKTFWIPLLFIATVLFLYR